MFMFFDQRRMPAGERAARRRRVPLAEFEAESGFAFTARTGHPELSAHHGASPAVVLEDGRPLPGPANALHDDIRSRGAGSSSFWYDFVYFATSDNSDPRTNGRRYEIEYPITWLQEARGRLRGVFRADRAARAKSSVHDGAEVPLRTWARIGFTPTRDSVILDFGCGGGQRVHGLRRRGLRAFGCDIALPALPVGHLAEHIRQDVVRAIDPAPYRIPFDDDTFDLVFSVTVFEHVMDYDTVLAEIRRVLKPGGISIHVFPGPWQFLESHVFVPWASKLQWRWWLRLWALAGIRNRYQGGFSARRTADVNHAFLKNETNYLSKREIRRYVSRHFDDCRYVEEAVFSPRRYAFFRKHPRLLRVYRSWFSETSGRVLVLGQKKTA
jgi:SAM-dependent methyltransferase